MVISGRRTITFLILFFFTLHHCSAWCNQSISGRIQIQPPYPAIKMVKVRKKTQDSCADEQISKSLLVSPEGGVANVVLWIETVILSEKAPARGGSAFGGKDPEILRPDGLRMTAILDQKNCNFEPHVILIPPGARLQVLNSDPLAHDVRAFKSANMLFRLDMDTKSKPEERSFDQPGIYTVRCGLHPWMHAFAVQAAHDSYAVTGADGTFALNNIPLGKHSLHIWHETLGEIQTPLEVKESVKDFLYTFNPGSSSSH